MLKTPEESTWLYHELGRCRMELKEYTVARALGEQSLSAAQEARDQMWQLNASVLIAQAESECWVYLFMWVGVMGVYVCVCVCMHVGGCAHAFWCVCCSELEIECLVLHLSLPV